MRERLRVLFVDDSPDDRALAIRELHRGFPQLEVEEVADARGFARALQFAAFDLVITDYRLCWSDGLSVLRSAKAQWPECPVIMFTGTGSEELAVQAMKAGLDDYVLKSPEHYGRLPAAAKISLKLAQQRRQLRHAEARYGVLFASVPVGLYRASEQGRILDANAALAEMLGYPSQAALLALNLADLYADASDYRQWQLRMEREGIAQKHEARLRAFDGSIRWVQNSARLIRDLSGGRVYEGSLEDLTERKAAEDERERLIVELQEALAAVKTLSGLLPICAGCKKIRDEKGDWNQIETFIQTHSDAEFTHSFCPECLKNLYPDVYDESANVKR